MMPISQRKIKTYLRRKFKDIVFCNGIILSMIYINKLINYVSCFFHTTHLPPQIIYYLIYQCYNYFYQMMFSVAKLNLQLYYYVYVYLLYVFVLLYWGSFFCRRRWLLYYKDIIVILHVCRFDTQMFRAVHAFCHEPLHDLGVGRPDRPSIPGDV